MVFRSTPSLGELGGSRMSLRSWAIRGLILAGVAVVVTFGWLANSWVSPERVRADVIENLSQQFNDKLVEVQVGSARMRILGGIAVTDLKLIRKGEKGNTTVLTVPSAVFYHDKEQLNRGRLVIKRIELDNPELNLERGADGKWNLDDIEQVDKPMPADKPVPTFIIRDGTVHIHDLGPEPLPNMTLTNVELTLLNDPIPVLAIQARAMAKCQGASKALGPIAVRARKDRIKGVLSVGLELADAPLGELIARNADRFAPGLSQQLSGLTAAATLTADFTYSPLEAKKWQHHVRVELKDARYIHPDLPWPVENITAAVHVVDGRVTVEQASAQIGSAKVRLKLESRANDAHQAESSKPEADDVLTRLEKHLESLELAVDNLMLDDVLFRALPPGTQKQREKFSPVGLVDLNYKFTRMKKNEDKEKIGWLREFELRPKQIAMTYYQFKYPVKDLRGKVKRTVTQFGEPTTTIDLLGTAGEQTIAISGQIRGEGDDPGINLRVTGANVPINRALYEAFPAKYAELVRRFGAEGRGDFVAEFVQAQGVNLCENVFRINIRDAKILHKEFPYPLEKVKGLLIVRIAAIDANRPIRPGQALEMNPDRDEITLDKFTAVHEGATLTLNGSRRPIPGSRDKKLHLYIEGTNCPVDDDLRAICRSFKIDSVRRTFNPRGKLTFTADLDLVDRAAPLSKPDQAVPFNPGSDLKLTFSFSGATVTPTFFRYELNDFAGWLEYKDGRVELQHLAGRHGESRLKLAGGEALFYPDGTVWANLGKLEVKPLIADEAFIDALPGKLASGVREMKIKGGVELFVTQLVVLTPPDSPARPPVSPLSVGNRPAIAGRAQIPGSTLSPDQPDPIVFWDLELKLMNASFDTGVLWEQVFGSIGSIGRYESTHLGALRGAMWFDSTSIAGQPVTRISGRFGAKEQPPDSARPGEFMPSELEFTDLRGELFHGILGGEARVGLTAPVRFNLWLKAADVQLDEVAKHFKLGSDADLKGIAQAQLRLYNRPDPVTGQLLIEGWGVIDVPTGRMYNLPILLDLVKLLKFQTPNKTAFEEAHATFRILGDRVKVEQIDLIGRAVCLGGSGEFDTSGNFVKFDFYTIFSQLLAQLINTPVGDLTAYLSKNLYVIRLTRENGELKYKSDPVPIVTDPARAIADRLRVRVAQMFGGK